MAIFEPRDNRCGSVSAIGAPERRTEPAVAAGIAVVTPSVVLTMITVQRALWLMRLGTLPNRNSLRPAMPAFPTTRTSISASSAAPTIAIAGSVSTTTCDRPRSPASRRASTRSDSEAAEARVRSLLPNSVSTGFVGTITWTRCSSASKRSAKSVAQPTAREAVCDRSVPTMTRRMVPVPRSSAFTMARIIDGSEPTQEGWPA